MCCAGHHNVHYVGDRQRQPHQLNGKSANLNHVITQKIYKGVTAAEQVPEKDILMVMDCDHMCKPELFNKMGPCMRDRAVGVTLVPQWFHNLIMPGAGPLALAAELCMFESRQGLAAMGTLGWVALRAQWRVQTAWTSPTPTSSSASSPSRLARASAASLVRPCTWSACALILSCHALVPSKPRALQAPTS